MIEDVYEPLARYRDEFREKFATLAREKFKELTDRSGVDVRANRALVADGLARINNNPRPCIAALLGQTGAAGKPVTATDLSFSLIPEKVHLFSPETGQRLYIRG